MSPIGLTPALTASMACWKERNINHYDHNSYEPRNSGSWLRVSSADNNTTTHVSALIYPYKVLLAWRDWAHSPTSCQCLCVSVYRCLLCVFGCDPGQLRNTREVMLVRIDCVWLSPDQPGRSRYLTQEKKKWERRKKGHWEDPENGEREYNLDGTNLIKSSPMSKL